MSILKKYLRSFSYKDNLIEKEKENFRISQQITNMGSWTRDLLNKEIYFSDNVYNILECNSDEFDGKLDNYYLLVHPDYVEEYKKVKEEELNGVEYDIEYRINTPIGGTKYVHEKTKAINNENKRPIKIVGIIHDITTHKIAENNLREIGENLNRAQGVSGVGSWKYDVIKDENFWSDEVYNIFNIDPIKFGRSLNNLLNLIHLEDRQNFHDDIKKGLEGKAYKHEYRIPQPDGTDKYVISKGEPIFDVNNCVLGIIGIIQDITENKLLENELMEYSKRIHFLVQESSDVFEIIDPDGIIKYISKAVENVIGFRIEERIGNNVLDFYEGNEKQKLSNMIELAIQEPSKKVQDDLILISKTGNEMYLEVIIKNFINEPSIQGIIINFRDITQRKALEKRMAHISTHDDLTDLPNKIYLEKKLELQCKYSDDTDTKFALMMLEIDGLKNLNYTLGYEYEDKLFTEVVRRLKEFLGDYIFISRVSEYKLAIIIQGISTNEGYGKLAKELIEIMKQQIIIDKFEISLSINIGICIYPDDAEDSISIKKNSNIAMLRSKIEGINKYKFFSSGLDIQYYKEFAIRNDLHKAIENNQFKVYYQPIVNLKTNEIIATEALIRWEHPDWGTLSPDEFIRLAEESGVIIEVGKWMLKEVCRNYNKWMENKRSSIKVSVNFSSIQFIENNFAENIRSILDEFKLNPHFLIMEITESVLISKAERVISDIKKLQSYGIQLALDDFGTGYSSLSYLNSFNIDILKIDRSFINKVLEDKTSNVITKTIINMAKELNIKLVAEGIENWEQLTYLRGLNCYSGQGYIYSKPIPLESFEIELSRGKCRPSVTNNSSVIQPDDRRKFFRINFHQMLEADMTVINFKGKNVNVGNTKVLVKNIGPGGLFFISNIKLPIDKDITLLFVTNLLNIEIKVYGHPIRIDDYNNLFEYGVEFTVDENERADLIKILNQVQIKMRNDILFSEGNFSSDSAELYFNSMN